MKSKRPADAVVKRQTPSRKAAVGIREVAAAAGVSPATVSQVYNHKGEASAATRERVLSVGDRLGYRPNPVGQALRSGRSRVIGVVVSYRESAIWQQTYMPYYQSIIAGAAIEAVDHGYSISAAPSTEDGEIETRLPLDGVIVVDPIPNDPVVEQCMARGLAVVIDGGYSPATDGAQMVSVRADVAQGIPTVLDHLWDQHAGRATGDDHGEGNTNVGGVSDCSGGSRAFRPALFTGPRLDSYTTDTTRAYLTWCERRGLEPVVASLALGQSPLDVARTLLVRGPGELNAVHCLNETYCNAATAAAAELGLAIPTDLQISVAGSAYSVGSEERAAYLNLDPVASGALCARSLIELLEGRQVEDHLEPMVLVPARRVDFGA